MYMLLQLIQTSNKSKIHRYASGIRKYSAVTTNKNLYGYTRKTK